MLIDLELGGRCVEDTRHMYWTAKLCPRKGVTQYHVGGDDDKGLWVVG